MPATRHSWLSSYATPNPFDHSILRPLAIVESEDVDIPYTPPGAAEPTATLQCSRHDFIFPYMTILGEERIGRGRLWNYARTARSPPPRSARSDCGRNTEIRRLRV